MVRFDHLDFGENCRNDDTSSSPDFFKWPSLNGLDLHERSSNNKRLRNLDYKVVREYTEHIEVKKDNSYLGSCWNYFPDIDLDD